MRHANAQLSPTPEWAVQSFTFANSIGTALVTNGVYFITDTGLHFSRTANFWLAAMIGITYIIGAGFTPRLARALRARGLSSRGLLILVMVLLGSLCTLPLLASRLGHGAETRSAIGLAVLWFTVLGYNTLTGVLWPTVESYVSGGRSGDTLRTVMGRWNVCWSAAAVPANLALAPLVEKHPNEAIAIMAAVHAAALFLLPRFTAEPVPHVESREPHPAVYERLLLAFRLLMPMGYMVLTTLTPMLSVMFREQGVSASWGPILGLSWVLPRIATFALLAVWGGWHGRWWAAIVGGLMIVSGFGVAVLAPLAGTPSISLPLLVLGLAVFGSGMGLVYSGAIYYAMEVHASDVEGGGIHETLVGIGYTLGPAAGLVATWASLGVWHGRDSETVFGPILFSIVGVAAAIFTLWVVHRVTHLSKDHPPEDRHG